MNHEFPAGKNGLAIYLHDGPAAFRFSLAGELSGEGVRNLEQAWRTASSIIGERPLVVDLGSLTGIDRAGRQLLAAWQAGGACMLAPAKAAPRIETMLEQSVTILVENPRRRRWHPFRFPALDRGLFLASLSPARRRGAAARPFPKEPAAIDTGGRADRQGLQ